MEGVIVQEGTYRIHVLVDGVRHAAFVSIFNGDSAVTLLCAFTHTKFSLDMLEGADDPVSCLLCIARMP